MIDEERSADARAIDPADPELGPPAWIGPVGIVLALALTAFLHLFAHPHDRLIKLLIAFTIVQIVHVGGIALVGQIVGLHGQRIGLFLGGAIVRVRVRRTWLVLGWFPLGGYVKFERPEEPPLRAPPPLGSWYSVHPLLRAITTLAGPIASLVLACCLMPPPDAMGEFCEVPRQLVEAMSGRYSKLLTGFVHFADEADTRLLIAVLAVKLGAFNLLPLTMFNGGQALIEVGQWVLRRSIPSKTLSLMNVGSLFGLLAFFFYSLYAVVIAWRAAPH